MENRRPSKAQDGKHSREYQHRSTKRSHQTTKDTSNDLKSQNHPQSTRPSLPALSGDDDYVRQWLAQTDHESKTNVRKSTVDMVKSEKNRRPKHGLLIVRGAADELQGTQSRHGKRRRRNSSSDSSLLELAIQPKSTDQKITSAELRPKTSPHTQKKSNAEPLDAGFSSPTVSHQETFEKRARRKTREDLYDTKKKKREQVRNDEGKRKARRTKKGDGKKAARKAGEDLMSNFTSKRVSQNRLTIRPSQGLGLFNNGRASSPAKRRGLPDLAFSEMEFLQRSRHVTPRPEDKTTSKSRDKEVRRAERANNEMSTFFRRASTPLKDSPNVQHKGSSHGYVPQAMQTSQYPRSRSFDFPENFYPGPHRSASSHKLSTPGGFSTFKNRSGDGPDTNSKYSGRAATYISWSETQLSPHDIAKSRQISTDDGQISPIPDSVRVSIERTGIFRGTGISLALEKSPSRKVMHPFSLKSNNSPRTTRAATEDSITRSPTTIVSERQDRNTHSKGSTRRPSQVAVEHYDQNLKLHQHRSSKSPEKVTQNYQTQSMRVEEPESTPVDRKQLARKARIKRRSTNLPAVRATTKAQDTQAEGNVPASKTPKRAPADPQISARQDTPRNADIQVGQEPNAGLSNETRPVQCGSIQFDDNRDLKSNLLENKLAQATQAKSQMEETLLLRHDNSTRHPHGLNPEPFKVKNDTSVLRELQSWVGQSGGHTGPLPALSSMIGVESLYFHQMQQNLAEYPQISQDSYVEESRQPDLEDYLAEPDPRWNSNWDSVRDGIPTENEYDIHQLQLDDAELEAYADGVTGSLDMWQSPEPTSMEEIEVYGSNREVEQSIAYPYEVPNELRRPGIFSSYGQEYDYQQPNNQEDVHMQGFWRPYRQY